MIRKLFGIFSLLFTHWTGLILYIAFTVISDSNNLESISFSLLPLIGPSLIPQSLTLFKLALLSLVGEVAEGVGVCLGVEDAVFKVVEGGGGGCSLGFEARRTGEEWMLLEEGGELVEGGDAEVCGEDAGSEQGEGVEGLSGCALLSSEGAIASVEVGPQRLQIKQGEGRPRRARGAAAQPWRCCSVRQGR